MLRDLIANNIGADTPQCDKSAPNICLTVTELLFSGLFTGTAGRRLLSGAAGRGFLASAAGRRFLSGATSRGFFACTAGRGLLSGATGRGFFTGAAGCTAGATAVFLHLQGKHVL